MSSHGRSVLDTSVLIRTDSWTQGRGLVAISVASIAELQFGVLIAADDDKRAERLAHLSLVQREFEPLVMDESVAVAYGQVADETVRKGRQPRRRQFDLVIAATALAHNARLITANLKDVSHLASLVELEAV